MSSDAAAPNAVSTPADEDLLAAVWQDCDDTALTTLLARYRGLVRTKARSYYLVGADHEDLVQEGMIGLYKAIRDFEGGRGSAFRAFADVCITRQIMTAIKSAARQKHLPLSSYVSLYLPVHTESQSPGELIDELAVDAVDPAERAVSSEELAELEAYCAEVLTDLEAEVLQRYVNGQSYEEIARALNRHAKAVDNALQRIKRKLDAHLASRTSAEGSEPATSRRRQGASRAASRTAPSPGRG